ncbi:MAG: hypothetical protein AVDCRST_MAG03-2200, partial [uncultured Rubrobacteraceae bacterium]
DKNDHHHQTPRGDDPRGIRPFPARDPYAPPHVHPGGAPIYKAVRGLLPDPGARLLRSGLRLGGRGLVRQHGGHERALLLRELLEGGRPRPRELHGLVGLRQDRRRRGSCCGL